MLLWIISISWVLNEVTSRPCSYIYMYDPRAMWNYFLMKEDHQWSANIHYVVRRYAQCDIGRTWGLNEPDMKPTGKRIYQGWVHLLLRTFAFQGYLHPSSHNSESRAFMSTKEWSQQPLPIDMSLLKQMISGRTRYIQILITLYRVWQCTNLFPSRMSRLIETWP